MTLRRQDSYSSDAELNRKLKQLEQNVSDEFDAQSDPHRLSTVRVQSSGYVARPGQMVLVDSISTVELLLATPVAAFEGLHLVVIARSGNVVVRPIGATIDGLATETLGAVGAFMIHCAFGSYYL